MAMMHLRFPKKSGFFSWDELGLMARALGFAVETFSKCLPDDIVAEEPGLKTKAFLNMLNDQKFFHIAINCSFNVHTDEWNVCVINKAVSLLDGRIISFDELLAVRVAFQIYEASDTKGMRIDDKILQRALKMCGRMISPMKMMHRIKHMKDEFQEEGRIQLHEFLDLLLWCDPYVGPDLEASSTPLVRNTADIFEVDDFNQVLQHYDERLAQKLNKEYLEDEWAFSKVKHGSKPMPKEVPPVDPGVREEMVSYHSDHYKALNFEVHESEQRVYRAQAGLIRDRPVNSPDLLMYEYPATSRMAVSTIASHRPTVMQTFGNIICPSSTPRLLSTASEIHDEFMHVKPKRNEYQRPNTVDIVTPGDFEATAKDVEALKFEMETIGMKYTQHLRENMDFVLPGYRGRKGKRAKVETPAPQPPKASKARPRSPLSSREPASRLAAQPPRVPAALHRKACDARFRGWEDTNKKSGSHTVLVAPAYNNSERGILFTKMYQNCLHNGNRTEYVSRHNKQDISTPLTPRKPCTSSSVETPRTPHTPRRSVGAFPSGSTSEPKRMRSIRGVRISEPQAQFLLSLHESRPSSDESSVLQRTSNESFQRLCGRAVDAGSKRLYHKLILGGM